MEKIIIEIICKALKNKKIPKRLFYYDYVVIDISEKEIIDFTDGFDNAVKIATERKKNNNNKVAIMFSENGGVVEWVGLIGTDTLS